MIELAYNIDFEIIAFLFAILLYIEMRRNYPVQSGKNREFRMLTILVIITEAFDLLSAVTNTYAATLPHIVSIFVNSGYFMSGLLLCYTFHHYIEVAVIGTGTPSRILKLNQHILVVIEIAVVFNSVFGYFFFFSPQGVYTHGRFYLALHLVSLWFVLCASAALFANRKMIEKKRMVSSVLFISLYFIAVLLQTFIFPDVLIIMPAVSAMLVIAVFSLESPDYLKLQEALKELTDTKRQLEEANIKYYNLAYTDLMTGLKNRSAYNIRLDELRTADGKENIIILMADINGLKQLNDKLGHLVGDDAIEKAARLLKKNFNENCQCYRIGGDEFAVIGYGITEEAFAENYCHFTEDVKAAAQQSPYHFSIAVGYQSVGPHTVPEAQKLADKKMYANKTNEKAIRD